MTHYTVFALRAKGSATNRAVLEAIAEYQQGNDGRSPTAAHLSDLLGLAPSSVRWHTARAVREGKLIKNTVGKIADYIVLGGPK